MDLVCFAIPRRTMEAVTKGWILEGDFIPPVIWTAVYLHGELQSLQFKDPSGSYIKPSHHLKEQAETHQGDAKI